MIIYFCKKRGEILMKRKIKSNNAITLVALVVTINERRTISWQNGL
jgi:hypothetical protein